MKSLVIGNGQVGKGLYDVISKYHETYIKDVEDVDIEGIEVLHICYPYHDKFIWTTNDYIKKYKPSLVINHASVAIGTTEKIGLEHNIGFKVDVVYSPIRGKHPNLSGDIATFDKFIAGETEASLKADKYFAECGMRTVVFPTVSDMRNLEFSKLMTNIRYGYEICFMQELDRIADAFGVDSKVFSEFEKSYNAGYKTLNQEYMTRPILYGGLIGGHCVMQCAKIVSDEHPSEMFDWMFFSQGKKQMETENKIKQGVQ